MTGLVLLLALTLDLDAVRAEPDPAKRAVKAFEYSYQQLATARQAALDGDSAKLRELAPTIADGAELAETALTSGKKNAGNLKKAELRCRDLLRRIVSLKQDAAIEDRDPVEAAEKRVHSVQDRLVAAVMGRSK